MLELFGWNLGMTGWAAFVLIIGALVIGVIFQYVGDVTIGYEWAVAGLGALVGGWLGSESLGALSTWGPVWDGMYLLPALIGGVLLGFVVDLLARTATGGSYVHHPRPI
ncbi:MAG TPA: hypothetical protein VJA85_08100 [Candidatus Limnocylindria bacterium]|nr:hypothetical protein [Candidatus Limnocylindria bacterium]